MDRSYIGRLITANTQRVLLALTQQQHLHPARSVSETAKTVCKTQGYSDLIGERAVSELAVSGQTRIGRLSRQQLTSLANSMESTWQVQLANDTRATGHRQT
jgi:hypothetical protein